ncbi:hypothetical protein JZ751_017640 [Albula glossodonta]|uniref:SH3 domain-containing protein n=1 Tax=Albula glossodonta TaxID=121402 RepID=A0A8T2PKD8_9TELE|nr:hypothetical protein JZ751_017640 [Albula glossodonta]
MATMVAIPMTQVMMEAHFGPVQRKGFAESIIKHPGNFQYRVEHLFTCEIDGRNIRDLDECVAQLKVLDASGKVWGQDMMLEVRDGSLWLIDIETKEELESLTLSSIKETKALLDTCIYNSMLTITVQESARRMTSIFIFQCEEIRTTSKLIWTEPFDSKRWMHRTLEEASVSLALEEPEPEPEPDPQEEVPLREYTEIDRNVDILNHVLNDVEVFMGRVAALGELKGEISNPTAPEFVHCFFSILEFLVPHCPPDLPPTIVSPLLTDECIKLLSEEATQEEDQLWQSLGDAWNIPRSKWPDDEEDIPAYVAVFSDGWEPPMVVKAAPKKSPTPKTKSPAPKAKGPTLNTEREPQKTQPLQPSGMPKPPKTRADDLPPNYMRVMYDFTARNQRELSIMRGDVVQVLDKSKQWWEVRNDEGVEGYVPHNVLISMEEKQVEKEPQEVNSPPSLNKRSKPEDVRAWLEYKEFSKITVRCLGVLSGSLLLGMTREELKEVCPEEGGRVFFQLQTVKNALAPMAYLSYSKL